MATPFQLVIDCSDPDSLAGFWAEAIGYVKQPPPPGYDSWEALLAEMGIPEDRWNSRSAIVPPDDDTGTRIFFQQVPEPKATKNRLHLDISVGAGSPPQERPAIVDAEVERLVGLGATKLEAHEEFGEYWVGMRDPEGNEFDVQ